MDDLNLTIQAQVSQPSVEAIISQPTLTANISQPAIGAIVVTGPRGPAGADGTGNFFVTGQYPIFYDAGSGVVGIVSGYYVTFSDLTSASGAIVAQISASVAGVSSLNGLSGALVLAATNPLFVSISGQTLYISGSGLATSGDVNGISGALASLIASTGSQAWNAANNNAINLSGNLGESGSFLYNLITGNTGVANVSGYITTGQADLRYYPLQSNPSGYLTTGQSGQFYPTSNPQNYATSGDLDAVSGVLGERIEQTGASLYALITGNTGTANLSGYITTGQADLRYYPLMSNPSGYITTGQTGQFYPASNPQAYATSGDLLSTSGVLVEQIASTGSSLYALITGNTGVANLSGYLTTGQADQRYYPLQANPSGYITTGQTGQFYPASNPQSYARSGDLYATGHVLIEYISGASGALQGQINGLPTSAQLYQTGATLYALITGASGQASIDYATKIQLTQTGATLNGQILSLSGFVTGVSGYLQDQIAASNAGVISVNGKSGIVSLVGTGGISVLDGGGNVILVSGDQSISGALTLTGQTLDAKINSLSGFVGAVSGGLDVRIADTGRAAFLATSGASGVLQSQINALPTTAYVNGIGINLSGNLAQTGTTLIGIIAQTGQQAWTHSQDNALNLSGSVSSLSGFAIGISGYLQNQITDANADVSSINRQSGALLITGTGGLTVISGSPQLIIISGDQSISGYVSSVSGGLQTQIAQTGAAAVAFSNGMGVNLSGNLAQTGATLLGVIAQTGQQAWTHGQNNALNLSGSLYQTGVILGSQINSLSGFVTGVSGALEALIATSAGGVTMVNGQSGALNLAGTGGLTVVSGGPTLILVSGDQSISGYVNGVSGALEVRIAQTGAATISYANGIGVNLSGNLAQSGVTLGAKIDAVSGWTLGISGALQTQITEANADVSSINRQSGALLITGTGGLTVLSGSPQLIIISGDQSISGALTQSGVALINRINLVSGVLATGLYQTGANLYGIVTGMSGWANTTFATITNLGLTGQALYNQYAALSGALSQTGATLLGVIAQSGQQAWNAANNNGINLSGQLTATGQTLYNLITNLSGLIAYTGNQLSYLTGIPTGSDKAFFNFLNYAFPSAPRVQLTLETQFDQCIYGYMISGRSTTGFWALFTDTILESGYSFNVDAKI